MLSAQFGLRLTLDVLKQVTVKPHILFVDDEPPVREMLSLFFRTRGFTVTTAVTVDEGKELAAKGQFDLAILDVDLAGENGLDLLGYLKRQWPALPVIIFTGLTGDKDPLDQAIAGGADGFMYKSDSLHELFAVVSQHLPQVKNPEMAGPSLG